MIWETISGIILKYWVELLLGLVAGGCTYLIKRYLKLDKEARAKERKEEFEKLSKDIVAQNTKLAQQYAEVKQEVQNKYNDVNQHVTDVIATSRAESKSDDAALRAQIEETSNQLNTLKAGLLSMQGKEFRNNCRRLLEATHTITLDEWEEINADHAAYNGLGGNHRGDELFEMVRKRAEYEFTKIKKNNKASSISDEEDEE